MALPNNLAMSKFSLLLLPLLAGTFHFHNSPNQHSLCKSNIIKHINRSIYIIIACVALVLIYNLFTSISSSLYYSLTLALIFTLLLIGKIFSTSRFSTQSHRLLELTDQVKNHQHQPDRSIFSGLLKSPLTLLVQSVTIYSLPIKVTNFVSVRNLISSGTTIAVILLLSISQTTPVVANTQPYKIKFVNLDTTSDTQTPQVTPKSLKPIQDFTFTISNLSIDFDNPAPNTLVALSNTLTIGAGGIGGYSVTASTNHPLKLEASTTTIPDTACDNQTCDPSTAKSWIKTTTHGFGYNLTGDDLATDFKDSTYFRPFTNQTPPIIMLSTQPTTKSTAIITYQLNLPVTQAAGDYQNQINYVAIPTY